MQLIALVHPFGRVCVRLGKVGALTFPLWRGKHFSEPIRSVFLLDILKKLFMAGKGMLLLHAQYYNMTSEFSRF